MIDSHSNEKRSEKLAQYMSDCVSLSEEIRQGVFELKLEDNLYRIIEENKT